MSEAEWMSENEWMSFIWLMSAEDWMKEWRLAYLNFLPPCWPELLKTITWCEGPTHWKRPRRWERLRAGGEGDERGWDGWMASPTQWTWIWASSGNWWWTGKPSVLHAVHEVAKSWARLSDWTTNLYVILLHFSGSNQNVFFLFLPSFPLRF